MLNLSFAIGSVVVTPFFWSMLLAAAAAAFSFWRKLKDDYQDDEIFSLSILIGFSALVIGRLFFVFFNFSTYGFYLVEWFTLSYKSNFSLSGAFLGAVLAGGRPFFRSKKKYWEIWDALVLPLAYFLLAGSLGKFLTSFDFTFLAYAAVGVFLSTYSLWAKKRYRSFSWYKSGKTGFVFSSGMALVFSLLFLLAILFQGRLYCECLISLLFSVISLFLLYFRSERSIKEDLKINK